MAARKRKPARRPRAGATTAPPPATLTVEERLNRLDLQMSRTTARINKVVDKLVPMLRAWDHLRKRIPTWVMTPDDMIPDAGEE